VGCGAVAQLGERCNRTAEVTGSIPVSSIHTTYVERHRSSEVEHSIRNRAVVSSILTGGSDARECGDAGVAQLVEHQLPKLRVAGSNPVSRFFRSLQSKFTGAVYS
jgi:hypothetical protein